MTEEADRHRSGRALAVFGEAVALDAVERQRFLNETCAGDVELHAEVSALLDAHDASGPFDRIIRSLALPSLSSAGGSSSSVGAGAAFAGPVEVETRGREPGSWIGPYRIVRETGRGGMGAVYLAEREDEGFRRQVALKLGPIGIDSEELRRRFLNERRAMARLVHPYIARFLDGGMDGDGRLYLVMEYVEGVSIDRYCDERGLNVQERLRLFGDVCKAVQYAHQNRVVHRDLKPGNILVTADGRPKLLDFGVAKLLEDVPGESTVTRTGLVPMTPQYASPEQVRGERITVASDVYSLGIVLYELLTGHRPYRFGRAVPREIERVVCDVEPELPSTVVGRTEDVDGGPRLATRLTPEAVSRQRGTDTEGLRRSLQGDLDTIVLKALRKEPGQRYASTGEMAADIGRYLAGLPVKARPDSPGYRASRFVRRHRSGVVLAAAGLVSLIGFAIATLAAPGTDTTLEDEAASRSAAAIVPQVAAGGGVESTQPVRNVAEPATVTILPFSYSGDESYEHLGPGMAELLSRSLEGAGNLRVVDPRAVRAFLEREGARGLGPAEARAAAMEFHAPLSAWGAVTEVGGRLRITAALLDLAPGGVPVVQAHVEGGADDIFRLVDRVAAQLLAERPGAPGGRLARVASRTTESLPALKAYLEGEQHLAAGLYEPAVDAFQAAVSHDSAFALAHYRLGVAAEWAPRPELMLRAGEMAVRHGARLAERDRLLLSASLAWWRGEPDRSEALLRELLATYREDVEAWFRLGEVLFHYNPLRGRSIGESMEAWRRVVALEPDNDYARLHLARVASVEYRDGVLASTVPRAVAAAAGDRRGLQLAALRALGLGDRELEQSVRERLDEDEATYEVDIWYIASFTRDLDGADRLLALLTTEESTPSGRGIAHLMRAHVDAGRGRWDAAKRHFEAAREHTGRAALVYEAALATLPFVSEQPEVLERLRHDVQAWDAGGEVPSPVPRPAFTIHTGAHPLLRLYALGLLSAALGEESAALRYADMIERAAPASHRALARDLSAGVRADLAMRRERPAEALRILDQVGRAESFEQAFLSPFIARARERYLRAEALVQLGRHQEAVAWLASMGQVSPYELAYLAPSHLRAARIHEAMDEGTRAGESYAHFTELWRRCDVALRDRLLRSRWWTAPLPRESGTTVTCGAID